MDLQKATSAAALISARTTYQTAIKDFQAVYNQSAVGVTEVQIPRKWLPTLVELAKRDIETIDAEIAKL